MTAGGARLAPVLGGRGVAAVEAALGRAGPRLPVLARQVADNLRSVGLYSRSVHREYFRRVAAHLAGGLHVFRCPPDARGVSRRMSAELEALVRRQIVLDDTVELLRSAAADGKGLVIVSGHLTQYLFVLARVNLEVPLTVFLRHSREPGRRWAKEQWCRCTGLDFIAEPSKRLDPTHRAAVLAEALQRGRVVVITPDLPQKESAGAAAVRLLGRGVWLPSGPAALSLLTGAPLLTTRARTAGDALAVSFEGPLPAEPGGRSRGWRRAAVQERMQWFAERFESWVRESPAAWFLWGDNRWTKVFRGDRRYARPLDDRPANSAAAGSLGVAVAAS